VLDPGTILQLFSLIDCIRIILFSLHILLPTCNIWRTSFKSGCASHLSSLQHGVVFGERQPIIAFMLQLLLLRIRHVKLTYILRTVIHMWFSSILVITCPFVYIVYCFVIYFFSEIIIIFFRFQCCFACILLCRLDFRFVKRIFLIRLLVIVLTDLINEVTGGDVVFELGIGRWVF
jgi:hypothetical protein